MKTQTATEWLLVQLYEKGFIAPQKESKINGNDLDDLLEQAKAMEKEQMKECFLEQTNSIGLKKMFEKKFDNYYNEKYAK